MPDSTRYLSSDLNEHLSMVGHKIQMLLRNIEELKEQDYPSQGPSVLAEVLIRILSRFFDELKYLSRQIGQLPVQDILSKANTIHFSTVQFIPRLIMAIRDADISSPIGGVVEAYGKICNEAQYGSRLILYPSWEYNASYRETMSILRHITKHLGAGSNEHIFDGTYAFLPIITFPASEEEVTLRQALIAHEIGHFIDETRGISEELFEEQLYEDHALQSLAEAVEAESHVSIEQATEFIEEATRYWIQEIVADYLAVYIMGPSFIFAFDEFTFSTYPVSVETELRKSHPPIIIRKRLMARVCYNLLFRELEKESWSAQQDYLLLEKLIQRLKGTEIADMPKLSGIRNLSVHAPESELPKTILSILVAALERASILLAKKLNKGQIESWYCTPNDIRHAFELRYYLEAELTPTELYSNPLVLPSFAAVMNAGWFYVVEHSGDFTYFADTPVHPLPDPAKICDSFLVIQRLTAKAIESLNLQREFLRRGSVSTE